MFPKRRLWAARELGWGRDYTAEGLALRMFLKNSPLALLLLVTWLTSGAAHSRIRLTSPTVDAKTIEHMWLTPGGAARTHQFRPDPERIERTQRAMDDAGIRRLEPLGHAFIWRGWKHLGLGAVEKASYYLQVAAVLMPDSPEVFRLRAAVARSSNPLAIHQWIRTEFSGLAAIFRNAGRSIESFRRWTVFTFLLMVVFLALFALGQIIRYGLQLLYGIGNVIPGAQPVVSAGFILVFAALTTGVYGGSMLFISMVLVSLTVFQTGRERAGTIACLVMIMLGPFIVTTLDDLGRQGAPHARALQTLMDNPYESSGTRDGGVDFDESSLSVARLIVATAAKRRGDFREAVSLLPERVLAGAADAEIAGISYNLKGNALFGLGQFKAARTAYEASRRLVPARAEPAFNLARLLSRDEENSEGRTLLDVASGIDSQAVAKWSKEESRGANRHVIDMFPGTRKLVSVALGHPLAAFDPGRSPAFVFGAAGLLAVLLIGRFRSHLRVGWPCERCGLPSSMRMVDIEVSEATCDACTNIFLRSTPIDRRIRLSKEIAVARYSRFKRWTGHLVNLCLPGVGAAIRGEIRAVLAASVLLGIAAWYFADPAVMMQTESYWPRPPDGDGRSIALVCLMLAYLASLISTAKRIRGRRG